MRYSIVNPSDPYTVEADDFEAAAVACVLLGEGRYAFEPLEESGKEVPIFMLGGHEEWFTANFGHGLDVSFGSVNMLTVADILDSVTLERKERSSMNDIGGRAKELASKLRAQLSEPTRKAGRS